MHAIENLKSRAIGVRGNATRQLANEAMGRQGVLPLWFGEPDVSTPQFICDAAIESLRQGETFYTKGLGQDYLREALSAYMQRIHSRPISLDRIAVTVSGGNAINLAFQCILEQGDQVVTPLPTFPNLLSIPTLQGASIKTVQMHHDALGWDLNLDELLGSSRDAKAILINSPNNPTGWVMKQPQQLQLLEACRKRGTWIISDEVYSRIYFDQPAAPSFLEIAEPEDRVLVLNSFSKAWAMTGWRLGWLTVPSSLLPTLERIIEFSISSAPAFSQRAAVQALNHGEPFIRESVSRYQHNLTLVADTFAQIPEINFHSPTATFYAFFQVDDVVDNLEFAHRMIDEAGVGLAPGTTFDPKSHNWFRLCFAQSPERMSEALHRLADFFRRVRQ